MLRWALFMGGSSVPSTRLSPEDDAVGPRCFKATWSFWCQTGRKQKGWHNDIAELCQLCFSTNVKAMLKLSKTYVIVFPYKLCFFLALRARHVLAFSCWLGGNDWDEIKWDPETLPRVQHESARQPEISRVWMKLDTWRIQYLFCDFWNEHFLLGDFSVDPHCCLAFNLTPLDSDLRASPVHRFTSGRQEHHWRLDERNGPWVGLSSRGEGELSTKFLSRNESFRGTFFLEQLYILCLNLFGRVVVFV